MAGEVFEPFVIAPMLRSLRARADLSQRELAAAAGMASSVVSRLESGEHGNPQVGTLIRLVRAAGCDLTVVTPTGQPMQLPWTFEPARDRGGRHLPAHRDVRPVRSDADWWGSVRFLTHARPPTPCFTYAARLSRRRGDPLPES